MGIHCRWWTKVLSIPSAFCSITSQTERWSKFSSRELAIVDWRWSKFNTPNFCSPLPLCKVGFEFSLDLNVADSDLYTGIAYLSSNAGIQKHHVYVTICDLLTNKKYQVVRVIIDISLFRILHDAVWKYSMTTVLLLAPGSLLATKSTMLTNCRSAWKSEWSVTICTC
jgi:hypothetical protein